MGCATSKQKVCRKCQTPYSPVRRSHSMHVHHPPQKTGDSYHLVALTSSTLGSLKLDPLIQKHVVGRKDVTTVDAPLNQNQDHSVVEDEPSFAKEEADKKILAKEEFAMGMIEAKTWSNMIDGKIPKIPPMTPVRTPPGEPEMIDAWEMMEGLEDSSPLRPPHLRSFSFHVASTTGFSSIEDQPTPRVKENGEGDGTSSPKPGWMDSGDTDTSSNSNDTSVVSEFDPEVIATLRRALEDLPPPPADPFQLKTVDDGDEKQGSKKIGKDKLIVYFTSLRGVRKTYEECCHVRVILKGLGVKVDERDVSMHSRFKEELKELLAGGSGGIGLPSVFLSGKCVGGAEEIRRLNEEGMLQKLLENCEMVDDDSGGGSGNGGVCEACGDVRFVPCETCSGSCKIYHEDEDEMAEEEANEETEQDCGFQRCPDCNENGLIRCPICCE